MNLTVAAEREVEATGSQAWLWGHPAEGVLCGHQLGGSVQPQGATPLQPQRGEFLSTLAAPACTCSYSFCTIVWVFTFTLLYI